MGVIYSFDMYFKMSFWTVLDRVGQGVKWPKNKDKGHESLIFQDRLNQGRPLYAAI